MNSPSQVLSVFAKECISKAVSQIIRKLQCFKITLSGEDSGLENTWDEICVQLQDGYAYKWDLYEDTVLDLIEEEVNKMPTHEQLAIWLETESAYSYDEDEDDLESTYDPTEVCHHIKGHIYKKAGDWSNKRIRRNLV
ncbi:hypothetical protein [Algoriphagus aquimarinus]|uniref:Uncharacterized protein n=1 Tax=Algoriphagus aquimarinus TaxID=237018 RepID=A0A1I0Y1S8_9BACT|nr:hypothetical protein [Algoriphagus aquimarinus]SFB07261.1 hypothetical protein SAMN04489723_10468 [Algoriphagus aquimarinus]